MIPDLTDPLESFVAHLNDAFRRVEDQFLVFEDKIRRLEERNLKLSEKVVVLEEEVATLKNESPISVQPDPPVIISLDPTSAPPPSAPPPSAPPKEIPSPAPAPPPLPAIAPGAFLLPEEGPEPTLQTILEPSGKVNYNLLKKLARDKGEREFSMLFHHPALVGAALFRGVVAANQDTRDTEATLLFQSPTPGLRSSDGKVGMEILERSIYPLLKKHPAPASQGGTLIFTIGRLEENDITMPDPSISKRQAEIRVTREGAAGGYIYYLRDLGSTNGVLLNGARLNAFEVAELKLGDEIKLGRFFFLFTPPAKIRKRILETG